MKRFSLCCLALLLLVSCGLPPSVQKLPADEQIKPGRLLNIRIERWGTLRFSGLLGVREDARGLDYVLLDATGVKLLQAAVAPDGGMQAAQAGGPLEKTGLAPFLSTALARIWLQEPDRLPCKGSWLYRLCREPGGGKYAQAGPFTVWRVTGSASAGDGDGVTIYRQPWLGVTVELKTLGGKK